MLIHLAQYTVMTGIIEKIADALHLHKHDDETAPADPAPEEQPKPTEEETEAAKAAEEAAVAAHHKAVFDDSKVTVIFVLGGPGAGENCPHASGRKHKRY